MIAEKPLPQQLTRLNDDFDQRIVAHAADAVWRQSPQPGVERRMLDRVGAEIGRSTSIVRYAPGSAYSAHIHGGGEEILVLDGVLTDESGDYPAGSYVRNPPGTTHTPSSREGCTLFAKLWQFAADDRDRVHIDTRRADWHPGLVPGLSVMPLHGHDGISTALVRWAPNTRFNTHSHPGGEEILVLSGVFRDEAGEYPEGSWLRNPRWSSHTPFTGEQGALIYVKVGHLGATLLSPQES
ncbi:MAG: cupin domain-containing protein [Propionivibrio sp.]|uniref:Cupin domain-containing protein n=1 Tax=Candidatus Propionivibrio dominans TaxID=2954373 RepID=A0A9D7IH60_9RHOO|nr:cupin domain-containing protein [Candidatus Propionivibrio dominans]